ncbi:MAG: aspartate-semialdehyde dehydrogenase [Candidatus Nezhaarchaeota archaeon]|nr:aspartate-semialdehyde dehydrogenase [Candidatus Nezhaarchaeota archaeon]MCX8141958.1 aspartate-semialdehyde dehydrogenase [Candidatus Nezhaarchaeota archaeon]MDW8050261.1 aspartate-semialdehyde dehydrogenase [Nitrososphaerota archaeon]
MDKFKVAILGATGLVGQRFIKLLMNHPFFEVVALTASPKNVGKKYSEATKWMLGVDFPEDVKELRILETKPEAIKKCGYNIDLVFSALPSSVAREAEPLFAMDGFRVISNASAMRMFDDVPLMVPEINPDHLNLLIDQRRRRGWKGFIVTNPNCSTIILTLSLKPILDYAGIEAVHVVTMQAVSGAGFSGVTSMAIIDNVIPFIANEEEKIQTETLKILGTLSGGKITYADIKISASCNRVCVLDGHLESVFIKLRRNIELSELKEALRNFKGRPQELRLPTAPPSPVIVREELDRPQPRLDRDEGGGMSVVVGRMRMGGDGWLKYMLLGNNVVRGAAGNTILIGELMVKEGLV